MDVTTTKRLVQAVQELSLARSMERVMEIVRTVARELTGADGATFILREQDMCFYADEDAISPLWRGSRFPMSRCISGWAMINRKAAVIEDIYKDDRIPHDAYRPTFVKSLAMVPIRTMDPVGAIGNYWAEEYRPTEEQLTLLQSLADITAVSIENITVYNELEQRVEDRTSQLENANAKLQEAYKELEAFSYSVSHDLRAPLRSIIGYSQAVQGDYGDKLDDNGRRFLDIISKNGNRMNLLIDDLLRFSRLVKQGLERTEVDQDKMVNEVVRSFGPLRVKFEINPLPAVAADPGLLNQVWHNLVSNAIKYSSGRDTPAVEIGCRNDDTELVFYVRDNGAGFDMAYAHKLFGVFQRLHSADEFEGTGIGLALVKRIISRHGGRIWAESKVNEGATFFFTLS